MTENKPVSKPEVKTDSKPKIELHKASPTVCKQLAPFSMKSSQKITLTAYFRDDFGNKAAVKYVPQWSSSDSSVLKISPTQDGFYCTVVPGGKLGTATICVSAKGDGDLSAEVQITVYSDLATKAGLLSSQPDKL